MVQAILFRADYTVILLVYAFQTTTNDIIQDLNVAKKKGAARRLWRKSVGVDIKEIRGLFIVSGLYSSKVVNLYSNLIFLYMQACSTPSKRKRPRPRPRPRQGNNEEAAPKFVASQEQ